MSSFNTLLSFPVPGTLDKSILFSRAIFLTAGVANTPLEILDDEADIEDNYK